MDFSIIFKLRNKKIWWLDVIFYFVVALLVATIFSYLIFIIKNVIQNKQIAAIEDQLLTVGTPEQKEQEAQVILYKKKINDFSELIKNHEFASNAFAFIEENTQPNVWFKQFNLDEKGSQIQLMGEAENMEAFSRQTATFEKNEYVKSLGTLNSSLVDSEQIDFNLTLTLDPKIFTYIVNVENQVAAQEAENVVAVSGSLTQTTDTTGEEITTTPTEGTTEEGAAVVKSSEKMIFSFDIPLEPEVVGTIDQTNHAILISLPSGTDVTRLSPVIIFSEKATIYPESEIPQNFSVPVTYQVTAEDGSAQEYTITARIVQTPEEIEAQQKKSMPVAVVIFLAVAGLALLIVIGLGIFLFIKSKKASIKKK